MGETLVERLRNRMGPGPLMREAADRIEALETAIRAALACTPQIRQVRDVRIPHDRATVEIIYDCGDPWEILRAALGGKDDA